MILQIKNLTKTYNRNMIALDNISFNVSAGEFISIIGPSGAGKSTLLRSINQLVKVDYGNIYFDGKDVVTLKNKSLRRIRTNIGMIFQENNLINQLTVLQNVLHGRLGYKSTLHGALGLYSEEEVMHALALLDKLDLNDHIYKHCNELSAGQKQRVGIARALIQNPKLLLCDEPISALDPSASKVIMDHLKSINVEMQITCLLSLHHVEIAKKYSSRIIGINHGQIVFDGHPKSLTISDIQNIYGVNSDELLINGEDFYEL